MSQDELKQTTIQDAFWTPRLTTNAEKAIFHQWLQLEASGCIENFRIAAGLKDGLREGWFFADSDAYKWLDAAARVYASNNVIDSTFDIQRLKRLIDEFILLLSRAQMDDGYIFTYNQIHFPRSRWENLLIEHELYCHGHLIEAGVSHYECTGELTALSIARKAADLLVKEFMDAAPLRTDGHEEVEIALLRLFQVTEDPAYKDLASAFLERRGRAHPFAPFLIFQNSRVEKRKKYVDEKRKQYLSTHHSYEPFRVPPGNYAKTPRNSRLRWMLNALTGKYFQMHTPIRRQNTPVGHAVRFGYLETATAMLLGMTSDRSLQPAMQSAWDRMVRKFMFLTGGLGAVPGLEGFGFEYELDPLYAYAETCAALACMFWNWEMVKITGEAKYSDLFEWQLYNAAAPGMGLDGKGYLYNNPLASHGSVTRQEWFAVPCCPSNLSRTWASLNKYIYSFDDNDNLWVHQYIGNKFEHATVLKSLNLGIEMISGLPWNGTVNIRIILEKPTEFTLHLRLPSWAEKTSILINGKKQIFENLRPPDHSTESTASGYDPRTASFLPIKRLWSSNDTVEICFTLPIIIRSADRRVRGHRRKVAITRGPLVYCLESVDNPGMDIFNLRMEKSHIPSLTYSPVLLGGTQIIKGKTKDGKDLVFVPYHLWANRGKSQMTVWVNT